MITNKLNSKLKAAITLFTISFFSITTNAQLHVVKNSNPDLNGAVGIGTSTPTEKLDVDGSINMSGGFLTTGGTDHLNKNNELVNNAMILIGKNRTAPGLARIDLFPNAKNTDDGTNPFIGRFISRPNGTTSFMHNGTGNFTLRSFKKESNILFQVSTDKTDIKGNLLAKDAIEIKGVTGFVGIHNTNPTALLHIKEREEGDIQRELQVDGQAYKTNGGMWAGTSDKRTKKNINQYAKGLPEVMQLNPVTYSYNGKAGTSDTERTYVGLIAQEFAKIEPNAVEPFSYTEEGSNKTEEYLSLDATSVQYMLVNAIKEQQAKIESLEERLAKVAQNSSPVTTPGTTEISVLLEGNGTEKALLAQNMPNPFTTETRIEYFIPENSRNARMSFRDMTGKEIKRIDLTHDGIGAIEFSAKDLAAGIYSYVLYVNGSIVASKKMILRQ